MAQSSQGYDASFSLNQMYCGRENGIDSGAVEDRERMNFQNGVFPGVAHDNSVQRTGANTTTRTQWDTDRHSLGTKSLMDSEMSPTSSNTDNFSSINVLKLAQSWQQKQLQEQQQLEQSNQAQNINHKRKRIMGTHDSLENAVETEKEPLSTYSQNIPLIMEPKDLHSTELLSEKGIQELFVSTCFYGRLGFVQPPCCLLCTYHESMEGASPELNCKKLVVWRKNAETPLHPNQLDGNVLIMPCYVVRNMLKGQTVEGYAWDSNTKKVVFALDYNS